MIRFHAHAPYLAVLALAPLAAAQSQTISHPVYFSSPELSQPWASTFTVPRFDPSLGHLSVVVLNLSGFMGGVSRMENVSAAPIFAQIETTARIELTMPSPLWPILVAPAITHSYNLPAFDGTLDWAGTSGMIRPFEPVAGGGPGTSYLQRVLTSPAELALFPGPAGAPGTITFDSLATQIVTNHHAPSLAADPLSTIHGNFRIDYVYEPLPGPICTGVATWGGCPCGAGVTPNGCRNSVYPAGAGLLRTGIASLSNDTLALDATNVTGSSAIFVQSNALLDPGVFFGDGLRCIAGTTIRLGSSPISTGSASYPQGGQLSVSVRGAVVAPGMRYYQTYYRNVASFCTPATFNLTSGQAVLWQA